MKALFIKTINFYQKYISPLKRPSCIFLPIYPSCSEYTKNAIEKHGPIKGIFLGSKRILRCHPWQKSRFDIE